MKIRFWNQLIVFDTDEESFLGTKTPEVDLNEE